MKIRPNLLFLLPLLVAVNAYALSPDKRLNHFNISDSGLAIEGYDPVSYFSGQAIKGDQSIFYEYEGITYLFSYQENREQFIKNPQGFEPAFGGWCAWGMLGGEKVAINPKRFKIIGDKLYLFYDRFFTNTLTKWNELAEETSESALLEKADMQWQILLSK
jgi:YHS domain-containing protein